VKIPNLKKAQLLYERGYVVMPNPTDPHVIKAFERGAFKEFERHSRVGMVSEESFAKRVQELRKAGAKYVFLKTGAYRPADLARAILFVAKYKLDLLTVDGAGGGTGMSPWRMMNEWGIPTVYLESLLYDYLGRLRKKKAFIPNCAIAGGLALEDHIFKALALGAPYINAICMGRATQAAAMVGYTHGKQIKERVGENEKAYQEAILRSFSGAAKLKEKYSADFKRIPPTAIGMYTYYDRLTGGLQQLMAGARKFALKHISRDDIMAMTREAAEVSGISYVMDADKAEVDRILG